MAPRSQHPQVIGVDLLISIGLIFITKSEDIITENTATHLSILYGRMILHSPLKVMPMFWRQALAINTIMTQTILMGKISL
jgi:hypothetical protein